MRLHYGNIILFKLEAINNDVWLMIIDYRNKLIQVKNSIMIINRLNIHFFHSFFMFCIKII
jgi:hypothetical protein